MGIRDYEFRGRTYDQWELGEEFITGRAPSRRPTS